jgi:CRISPR-associated protein Cas2
VRLRSRLYDLINLNDDQGLFIRPCGESVAQIESLGTPTEAHDARDVVVVI